MENLMMNYDCAEREGSSRPQQWLTYLAYIKQLKNVKAYFSPTFSLPLPFTLLFPSTYFSFPSFSSTKTHKKHNLFSKLWKTDCSHMKPWNLMFCKTRFLLLVCLLYCCIACTLVIVWRTSLGSCQINPEETGESWSRPNTELSLCQDSCFVIPKRMPYISSFIFFFTLFL